MIQGVGLGGVCSLGLSECLGPSEEDATVCRRGCTILATNEKLYRRVLTMAVLLLQLELSVLAMLYMYSWGFELCPNRTASQFS